MHRKAELMMNGPTDTRPEFRAETIALNKVTCCPAQSEVRANLRPLPPFPSLVTASHWFPDMSLLSLSTMPLRSLSGYSHQQFGLVVNTSSKENRPDISDQLHSLPNSLEQATRPETRVETASYQVREEHIVKLQSRPQHRHPPPPPSACGHEHSSLL